MKIMEAGSRYLLGWLKVGCSVHVVLAVVVGMRWVLDSDVRDTLMCLWFNLCRVVFCLLGALFSVGLSSTWQRQA